MTIPYQIMQSENGYQWFLVRELVGKREIVGVYYSKARAIEARDAIKTRAA